MFIGLNWMDASKTTFSHAKLLIHCVENVCSREVENIKWSSFNFVQRRIRIDFFLLNFINIIPDNHVSEHAIIYSNIVNFLLMCFLFHFILFWCSCSLVYVSCLFCLFRIMFNYFILCVCVSFFFRCEIVHFIGCNDMLRI